MLEVNSEPLNADIKKITLPNSMYIQNVKCVNRFSKSIKLINN